MASRLPMSAAQACTYLQWGYKTPAKLKPSHSLNIAGVQAYLFEHEEAQGLLIEGSNERSDWARFNFRFWPRSAKGDSRSWHRGFLHYAQVVYAFAQPAKPTFVLGHSLGAAAAQIVGASFRVPTLAVASPRPLHDRQPEGHSFVQNICRTDDLICAVPFRLWGFKHVGAVHWMKPKQRHKGEDHSVAHYASIIEEQGDPLG